MEAGTFSDHSCCVCGGIEVGCWKTCGKIPEERRIFFIDFTQMLDITVSTFVHFFAFLGYSLGKNYLIFVYTDCVGSDIKFCCGLRINDILVSLLLSICCRHTDAHEGKQLIIMDPQTRVINYNMHTPRWPNPGIGFTEK